MSEESREKIESSNAPNSQSRRKAIKKLAVGVGALAGYSALPEKWMAPHIESIILPAHAQTSGVSVVQPISLSLLDGYSGTDEMTLAASGTISPPQEGVELGFTFEGYDEAVASYDQQEDWGDKANGFLASVADSLVPSAEAKPHKRRHTPKCKIKIKVKTDAEGRFTIKIKFKCGKGIRHVKCACKIFGIFIGYIGFLDIPDTPPTTTAKVTTTTTTTTTTAVPEVAEVHVNNEAPTLCELLVTDIDGLDIPFQLEPGATGLEGTISSFLKELTLKAVAPSGQTLLDILGTNTYTVSCIVYYVDPLKGSKEASNLISADDAIFSFPHTEETEPITRVVVTVIQA
ncbi:MAG: hypothetical protein D3924_01355 [Candidatus Electrothrix sp. AR4]|nr:hypothetical protein [Candidatus Electrothrix sp. AR4]